MPNAVYSNKSSVQSRVYHFVRKDVLPLPTSRSVRLEVWGSVLVLALE